MPEPTQLPSRLGRALELAEALETTTPRLERIANFTRPNPPKTTAHPG